MLAATLGTGLAIGALWALTRYGISSLADRFRTRYLCAVTRLLNKNKLILPEAPEDWSADFFAKRE